MTRLELVGVFFPLIVVIANPVAAESPPSATGNWGYAVDAARQNRRFVAYEWTVSHTGATNVILMISFETNLECRPNVSLSLRKENGLGELKNSGFLSQPMMVQVDQMPPIEDKPGVAIYTTSIDFLFPPNQRLFEQMMSGTTLHVRPQPSYPTFGFELAGLPAAIVQPRMDCNNAIK